MPSDLRHCLFIKVIKITTDKTVKITWGNCSIAVDDICGLQLEFLELGMSNGFLREKQGYLQFSAPLLEVLDSEYG